MVANLNLDVLASATYHLVRDNLFFGFHFGMASAHESFDRIDRPSWVRYSLAAGRFAHMLCGRCSFIYERELEQVQRRIEAAVAAGRWAEARRDSGEFAAQLAARRVSLAASDSGAVPPASAR